MAIQDHLLIVVDPTASHHPVIARAANIARYFKDSPPRVTVLFAADYSNIDDNADNDAFYRDNQWLMEVVAPLADMKLDLYVRLSWCREWADSILYSANRTGATSIVLPHPGTENDKRLSDEFWYLVRNTAVPISVIQSVRTPENKAILVAMDFRDEKLNDLNRRMLNYGKVAADAYKGELHLAHVYQDSMHYPDRAKIVERTGIPNENIHLKMGEVGDSLAEVVNEIGAGMVFIGATRRSGIRAALRGRKINKIMQTIEHDLVVVV